MKTLSNAVWKSVLYLKEADSFSQFVVVGGDGPHDDVGVAVHVLSQGVVGHVSTKLKWTLL